MNLLQQAHKVYRSLTKPSNTRVANYVDLLCKSKNFDHMLARAEVHEPSLRKRRHLHDAIWESQAHSRAILEHLDKGLWNPRFHTTKGLNSGQQRHMLFLASADQIGLAQGIEAAPRTSVMAASLIAHFNTHPAAVSKIVPLAFDASSIYYEDMGWFIAQYPKGNPLHLAAIKLSYACMRGSIGQYGDQAMLTLMPYFEALDQHRYVNAMLMLDVPHEDILQAIEERLVQGVPQAVCSTTPPENLV